METALAMRSPVAVTTKKTQAVIKAMAMAMAMATTTTTRRRRTRRTRAMMKRT